MAEYGALLTSQGLSSEQEVRDYFKRIIEHGI
jgi:hypothetical protein